MRYDIRNESKDVDIYIYDEIGSHDVNAKSFIEELKKYKGKPLNIHINSIGGEVFDGMAIANAIKQHQGETRSYVEGIAASIATIVVLAADKVYMSENSLFMINNAWGGSMGEANDLRKQADVLEKISNEIANTYVKKTNLPVDRVKEMMQEETWLNAEEAKEIGFVDEITEAIKVAAKYDVSEFKNITESNIKSILNIKTKKEMAKSEKTLVEKLKALFNESENINNLEEEEMEQEEEDKNEDAEDMPDWYKITYEELKERVQNLEEAVADLKADKENAKALSGELSDKIGELETANDTIVYMGREISKLNATPTNVEASGDPHLITKKEKVDPNTEAYNQLAELIKNKVN